MYTLSRNELRCGFGRSDRPYASREWIFAETLRRSFLVLARSSPRHPTMNDEKHEDRRLCHLLKVIGRLYDKKNDCCTTVICSSIAFIKRQNYHSRKSKIVRSTMSADSFKQEGNAFFKAGKYKEAIAKYKEATALDSSQPSYWSNMAAW